MLLIMIDCLQVNNKTLLCMYEETRQRNDMVVIRQELNKTDYIMFFTAFIQ